MIFSGTQNIRFYAMAIIFLALSFIFPVVADAAILSISPSSGTYNAGETFTIGVIVNSSDREVNAVSSVLSFPADILEVVSTSRDGSIIGLWVQEPAFSNVSGTINLEGIILNPGFVGNNGKALNVVFRAKKSGVAPVSFVSGSVLANNGLGTNVLETMNGGQYTISSKAPAVEEKKQPPVTTGLPPTPVITSSTHPDEERWYNINTPTFSWDVPSGVTAIRISLNKKKTATPTVSYDPVIKEKEIKNLDDGVYYFHAQFKNKNGWGTVSHMKIQIDTVAPEGFEIKCVDTAETFNPRPTCLFNTTDELSGLDYYKVKIGDSEFKTVAMEDIESNPYTLPPQAPGEHFLLVQALDKAGNYSTATSEIEILGIAAPRIIRYPEELTSGETLVVSGNTFPDSLVTFWVQGEKGDSTRQATRSNQDGDFTIVSQEGLKSGVYRMWATVTDQNGAISNPSTEIIVKVKQSTLLRFGSMTVTALSIIIPVIAIVIVIAFSILYARYRILLLRKKVEREISKADNGVEESFNALEESLNKHVYLLEKTKTKRALTKEEEKILKNLQKDLNKLEQKVRGNLKKVTKKINGKGK